MNFINRGVVLVEFAFIVPILILLSFGAYEVHRYVSIDTYLRTAGYRLALWSSQSIQPSSLNEFTTCLIREGSIYDMANKGTFIVTGMRTGNMPLNQSIRQLKRAGTAPTQVNPSYPNLFSQSLTMIRTIVVEVVYNYTPVFYKFTNKTIRHTYCLDFRGNIQMNPAF